MIAEMLFGSAKAEAARARGEKGKMFDWDKAAEIIREHKPSEAVAGLSSDMKWTAGVIYRNGAPVPREETYVYLSSMWATPVLVLDDGAEIPCWKVPPTDMDRDPDIYWPPSARAILNGGAR